MTDINKGLFAENQNFSEFKIIKILPRGFRGCFWFGQAVGFRIDRLRAFLVWISRAMKMRKFLNPHLSHFLKFCHKKPRDNSNSLDY